MKNIFNKHKIMMIVAIFCAFLPILLVGYTFAKYVIMSEDDYQQESSEFYFESNFLSVTGANMNINNSGDFVVSFRNYSNVLNYCKTDIDFTISVVGATVSGGSPVNNVYTLVGNQVSELFITISPNASSVSITATTTAPYTKTLSGVFAVTSAQSTYSFDAVSSGSSILYFNLNTTSHIPTITLQWQTDEYDYDNLNPLFVNAIANAGTATCVLDGLHAHQIYEIEFFCKTDGVSSAVGETEINGSSITIVLPTPVIE